jgi:hypothetical protein
MEGPLAKKSAHLKSWKQRYCRLIPSDKILLYYMNPSDIELNLPKGTIKMDSAQVNDTILGQPLCFDLIIGKTTIHWRAESKEVKKRWVAAMEKAGIGEVPDEFKSISFEKGIDKNSTFLRPETVKDELRNIVSADAEMTFRGVRRTLEENLGLEEGELYGVRDQLNTFLSEVITEKANIGLQIASPTQHLPGLSTSDGAGAGKEAEADDATPVLAIGSKLSVLSPTDKWRAAMVAEIDEEGDSLRVKVHYEEFNSKHDEWINGNSDRIRHSTTPVTPRGRLASHNSSPGSRARSNSGVSSNGDSETPQWLFTGNDNEDPLNQILTAVHLFSQGNGSRTKSSVKRRLNQ